MAKLLILLMLVTLIAVTCRHSRVINTGMSNKNIHSNNLFGVTEWTGKEVIRSEFQPHRQTQEQKTLEWTALGKVIVALYEGISQIKSGYETLTDIVARLNDEPNDLEKAKEEIIQEIRRLEMHEIESDADATLRRFSELEYIINITNSDLDKIIDPALNVISWIEKIIDNASNRYDYSQAYHLAKTYNAILAIRAICMTQHTNYQPTVIEDMFRYAIDTNHKLLFDRYDPSYYPGQYPLFEEYTEGILFKHLWYESGAPSNDREKLGIEYALSRDEVFGTVISSCKKMKSQMIDNITKLPFNIYDKGYLIKKNISMEQGEYLKYYIDLPLYTHNLKVEVTAASGDPDIYVTKGHKNLNSWDPYTSGDYEARAFRGGTYDILDTDHVVGWPEGASLAIRAYSQVENLEFSVSYEGGALEIMHPPGNTGGVCNLSLSSGKGRSYYFLVPRGTTKIILTLYELGDGYGDADLYAEIYDMGYGAPTSPPYYYQSISGTNNECIEIDPWDVVYKVKVKAYRDFGNVCLSIGCQNW